MKTSFLLKEMWVMWVSIFYWSETARVVCFLNYGRCYLFWSSSSRTYYYKTVTACLWFFSREVIAHNIILKFEIPTYISQFMAFFMAFGYRRKKNNARNFLTRILPYAFSNMSHSEMYQFEQYKWEINHWILMNLSMSPVLFAHDLNIWLMKSNR